MKVALYARVSSEKQDVDLSISAQLRSLRDYALRNGHEVVKEFSMRPRAVRRRHDQLFGR